MPLRSERIALISIFIALAVSIYVIETFIPRPFPWMRFGFGNIIVLVSLYLLGYRVALLITALKSILGAIIVGNFLTPSFIFSISGGIASISFMALLFLLFPSLFSPLGLSVCGAVSHNLTQLIIASLLFIGRIEILHLIPVFLLQSVITGTITGIISLFLLRNISSLLFSRNHSVN